MINSLLVNIISFFSTPAYAEELKPPELSALIGPIEKLFSLIFPLGIFIAVAMVVYGGYMWIMSGGDPDRKRQAQGYLTWSLLGLVFLLLIKMLLGVIIDFVIPS